VVAQQFRQLLAVLRVLVDAKLHMDKAWLVKTAIVTQLNSGFSFELIKFLCRIFKRGC